MLQYKSVLLNVLVLVVFFSCKEEHKTSTELESSSDVSQITYAEGFSISNNTDYSILTIRNPWPKADKKFTYALVPREKAASITLNRNDFDAIILTPIDRVVVTSTTHIPALELLNVESTLVGFPETDYISSERTRKRIDNGKLRELGKNEEINTEVLLELRPDVVIAFGVDGTNKSMETISKARIPVIYNGDWVEKSPLAKAEWLKFFGALYGKTDIANSTFEQIESDYLAAKSLALETTNKPTVLCGAMYKDVWYLPNGTSPEAQFLKDANVNYLWSETSESGSLALSFEAVFDKARDAQLWLSPSYYSSYDDLEKANTHYTEFDAFQNRNIFTFSNTTGATGGVIYYELGTSRPDLVLKDMIKICHPDLLKDYKLTFFKPLDP